MKDDYVLIHGELYNVDELYHFGVKGMKWGKRKARYEARTERKYARAGRAAGREQYYREQAKAAQDKYNKGADLLDKAAKSYDKKGNVFKAEAARKAAGALRTRGTHAGEEQTAKADYYAKRAAKITEKASKYATKKRVDLGKGRVDSILKTSKQKGYDSEKRYNDYERDEAMRARYGNKVTDEYKKWTS